MKKLIEKRVKRNKPISPSKGLTFLNKFKNRKNKEDVILETSEHEDSADAAKISPILRIADK
jgi:hypothetical protein